MIRRHASEIDRSRSMWVLGDVIGLEHLCSRAATVTCVAVQLADCPETSDVIVA